MIKSTQKMLILLTLSVTLLTCKPPEPEPLNIIPKPERSWSSSEKIVLNENTRILFEDPNPSLRLLGEFLAEAIHGKSGFKVSVEPFSTARSLKNDILLTVNLNDSTYGNEGYILANNNRKFFSIQANAPQGVFYGIQSFIQVLPDSPENEEQMLIPAVHIMDKPRFSYRGMHLDVGRHFFPVSFIKQYIDLLAHYKYNYFHWHLTEDQGWRIEIKKYPELMRIASQRKETIVGHAGHEPVEYDKNAYGGFYTQEEVLEIVDYAARKYITIIPEIELPGHSLAALSAYPYLGCTGGPYEVATTWGVFNDVYCTKDEVFEFLENVLSEVIDLFPGQYIHIGGDEVPKLRWKECRHCQERIRNEGLSGEEELQSYFIKRIEKFIVSKGKLVIGWDEILEGGLAPNATVMSWRGTEGGIEAARMGHDVIMTPGSHCYFDHYQFNPENEPLAIGGLTKVSKVYAFEPVPEELNAKEAKHIIGAQANVWTEYLKTPDAVTYMILPRMAALSEVLWSPSEKRNWENFYNRLPAHFEYYKSNGWAYSDAVNRLDYKISTDDAGVRWLHLETEIPNVEIRFMRGVFEIEKAELFKEPVEILAGDKFHVTLVKDGKQIGKVEIIQ